MASLRVTIATVTLSFSFLLGAHASETSSTPSKLVFALQPGYAVQHEKGNLNHNIIVRMANALEVELELFVCPWARCLKAIESGQADLIDDLFLASDRAEYLVYLQPAFDVQSAGFRFFAINQHTPVIESWQDLSNKRVGLLRGYKHFPQFDNTQDLYKYEFQDLATMIEMLKMQRIDVFIAAPSFDESSIAAHDSTSNIRRQPYAHIEDLALYVGLSRKSAWFSHKDELEQTIQLLLSTNEP